jgi:DUF2075 family protein/archaellum biogenesis ATPase FlaH
MVEEIKAYIEEFSFSHTAFDDLYSNLTESIDGKADPRARFILHYPTVYIVYRQLLNSRFRVYVGETTNIINRTSQHLSDAFEKAAWAELEQDKNSRLFVIGHTLFNKSLTLDVENRLMHWLSSVNSVDKVFNQRTNPQNDYHTREHLDQEFRQIWRQLREKQPALFPIEEVIKESALFKASPFHKLTDEQVIAKDKVHAAIREANESRESGQLILVEGAAGSGKTVLLSSLFYELFHPDTAGDKPFEFKPYNTYLLVNHDQQLTVYQELAKKLGLIKGASDRVSRPTKFINTFNKARTSEKADIVLVDEAHLLWTQGKQGYQGKNQLKDILEHAKVVVAIYDSAQAISTTNYWEDDVASQVLGNARQTIDLKSQMRMNASPKTLAWIRGLIDEQVVKDMPSDPDYDLRIFDSPEALRDAIQEKAQGTDSGYSRLTATFDWPYSSKRKPKAGGDWSVVIDDFSMNWNLQIEYTAEEKRDINKLSWIEQPRTLDEIGSHFTVQGFDLNYAGVIIGPSVKYQNGQIVFDPSKSFDKNATQKRSMSDGSSQPISEELLRNHLNILLTRGVNGLYIYAVDQSLQEALLKAQKKGKEHGID